MKLRYLAFSIVAVTMSLSAHPDPSHTLQELQQHLDEAPNDRALLTQKAELLLSTGNTQLAEPVIKKLHQLYPTQEDVQLLEVKFLQHTNSPETLEKARALTTAHPTSAATWTFVSLIENKSGNRDAAIAAMVTALKLNSKPDPSHVMTCASWLRERGKDGDRENAITLLDQGLDKLGILPGMHQQAIDIELDLGRHDDALKRVDLLTSKLRPSVDLSLRRAKILESAGRFKEAASACDAALGLMDILPRSRKVSNDYRRQLKEISERKQVNLMRAQAA